MTTNEQARAELDAELAEIGLKPAESKPNKEEVKEEKPEEKQKEGESEEEKEDSKEKVSRNTREAEKDEESGKESKEEPKRPNKYKPLPEYLAEKNTWKAREKELLEQIESIKSSKQDDSNKAEDIEDEITAFAEESGIEDKEAIKKLIKIASKAASKETLEIKKKLEELEKATLESKKEETKEDKAKQEQEYFDKEWRGFEKELKESFEDLSEDQIKEARVLMDEISHTKEWAKYDLSYIFFKNRKDFEDALGTKKFKGPGMGNTQGITKVKKNDERPVLSDNPTAEEIKAYENYMSGVLSKSKLADRPDDTL